MQKSEAFTLVELIITIVILSILATIAFLSFSSYSSSSRDSVRLSDISNIAKGLVVQYSIGGSYIIPDNSINIYSGSTTIIGYQGKVGSNTINTIKLSNNNNSGKDPLDNTYYTYNINYNKSKYQVTGYLESKGSVINRVGYENDLYINRNNEQILINNIREIPGSSPRMTNGLKDISTTLRSDQYDDNGGLINQTYSTNYTNRYPYTKGDSIGVILSYTGGTGSIIYTPLEDSGTGIDISSGTLTTGKVVINNNTDSSTGVSVVNMSGYVSGGNTTVIVYSFGDSSSNPGLSCKDIKTKIPSSTNGVYWIKPDSNPAFQVYCDMTTDGGGWILIANIDSTQKNKCISDNQLSSLTSLTTFGNINTTIGNKLYPIIDSFLFTSGNYKYKLTSSSVAKSCLQGTSLIYNTAHGGVITSIGSSAITSGTISCIGCNDGGGQNGWWFGTCYGSSGRDASQAFNNYNPLRIIVNGVISDSYTFSVWVR